MSSSRGYEVGYKKPPRRGQFMKGQSGNPRGRPHGVKNVATILRQVLRKKITVTENGRRRQITKLEAALTQLVNRSAQGELKATQMVIGITQEIERRPGASTEPASSGEGDEQVLQFIRDHLIGGSHRER